MSPKANHTVRWSPRVAKSKLRRLYTAVARGLYDDDLINDVGITLYLRCRDILTIHRAHAERQVTCPGCLDAGLETLLTRERKNDRPMVCPACGWRMTWDDYHQSFKRKQLNPGGAVASFRDFAENYPLARDAQSKMLAIDHVIHEFHYSLKDMPGQATRAAGVNLIVGRLTDVIAFLDELSEMDLPDAFRANYQNWRKRQDSIKWDDILEKRRGRG